MNTIVINTLSPREPTRQLKRILHRRFITRMYNKAFDSTLLEDKDSAQTQPLEQTIKSCVESAGHVASAVAAMMHCFLVRPMY
eukprot:scaffold65377_cov38-Prasinocladus_malaysianus.AAC.1